MHPLDPSCIRQFTNYTLSSSSLSSSPSKYWIATERGEIKETHFFRALFERIKGRLGFGDRTSNEAITYVLLNQMDKGVKNFELKNRHLSLIEEVAIKCHILKTIPRLLRQFPSKKRKKLPRHLVK